MGSKIGLSSLQVWPEGIVLPDLEVERPACEVIHSDEGVAYLAQSPVNAAVIYTFLPSEFYAHELADLDVNSDAELAEFASKFGILDLGLLVDAGLGLLEERLTATEADSPRHEEQLGSGILRARGLMEEEAVIRARIATLKLRSSEVFVSVDEFRIAVQLLRDMTRIMQADAGALSFADVACRWESPLTTMKPANREQAVRWLGIWISTGLSRVHPTIRPIPQTARRDDNRPLVAGGMFDAVCVQLFNKIASGTGFKRCHNKGCGRLFSQQRARRGMQRPASWSSETTGLKYCCPECARAEASRARRSNIARAARLSRDGLTVEEITALMKAGPGQVERWLSAGTKSRTRD